MIKNNKGAILVVTIVSMMILTIIGYVTLQMVSNQNVMDTYYQTKIRVDYAAEGIVNRAMGHIDFITNKYRLGPLNAASVTGSSMTFYGDFGDANGPAQGKLFSIVNHRGKWDVLVDKEDDEFNDEPSVFDNSIYPPIHAKVYCEIVNEDIDGFVNINEQPLGGIEHLIRSYKLVGIASATVNTAGGVSTIVSTATCYFYTDRELIPDATDPQKREIRITNFIRGWRKS